MKHISVILFTSFLYCQPGLWQPGTAYTLPEGRWELGLFQPVRWGQGESREISFYKLSSLLMPNVTVKQRWHDSESIVFSTLHTFSYPTPLLKTLQSPLGMDVGDPNMFALISPEFEIPPMFIINNTALISTTLERGRVLTGKAGVAFALGSGDLAEGSSIDLPLIYHRLAVLYNGWSMRLGLDVNGRMRKNLTFLVDSDIFLIPGIKGKFAFEHKGLMTLERTSRFQISWGYKFIYGVYPDGYPDENVSRVHILPLLDLQWARD